MSEEEPDRVEIPPAKSQAGLWGEEFPPVLHRGPKSGAERKAEFVARRSDIGELPPVRNPERRARCEADLVEFTRTYCSSLLDHEPGPRQIAYLRELQAAIEGAGQVHIRCLRGGGKTTLFKPAVAWGTATGRLHYAVIFCASADLAGEVIDDVWNVFEFDETFAEDWPAVSHPIRMGDGMSQRYKGQRYHGQRTRIQKNHRRMQLPTIEGAPSSGATLLARGAGCKTRGLVKGKRRPDMVLLDDIQDRADAKNPKRVRELEAWIDGDVQGLAGARLLNAVMTSTPIVAGDLSATYADHGRHPEWRLVEYRMVEGEPERPELWDRYDELWRAARREGDMAFLAATEFYQAHRAEMDAGLDVFDPRMFDARLELSGIQHARNLLLTMGPPAFRAEYQLTVRASVEAVQITPQLVASRVNGSARGTLPPGTVQVLAFVDVNAVAGLSWCATAFGPHRTAAVVAYGRFPGGGRRLVPEGATEADAERIIASGLSELLRQLLDMRFPAADGTVQQLAAVWVDVGYRRRVVQRVLDVFRRRTGRLVWGCQGVSHDRYSATGRHVVQRCSAGGVDHRSLDGDRWFVQDADRWREWFQRAWLGEAGAPGSLSLPGRDPREHAEFAEEVCAESLADKITDARGIAHYYWTQKPGAGNHYLDAGSGTIAMGVWYRLLDDDDTAAAVTATATRRHVEPLAPLAPRDAPISPGIPPIVAHAHPANVAGSPPPAPRRAAATAARRPRFRSPTLAG